MLTLWGRANSSNVMKVICLLEELGLPYDRQDVGGAFGGTDTPEYRAMNPNGVVPTLVESGESGTFVLWESNVILRYLAEAHAAGTHWWPSSLHHRAIIGQWMDWQHTVLGAPMTVVFWGLVRTAPEKRDLAAIAAAQRKLETVYGILEAVLSRQDYVAGPEITVADLAIGVHAHRWLSFDIQRPPMPGVRAWYERLLARDSYRRHVAVEMT
jgi:glutathione S-transferase